MGCPPADHDTDPTTDPQPVCTGYELVSDLDFDENGNNTSDDTYTTGEGWDPIGDDSNPFATTFEGNGNTISNLVISRSTADYVGLFGAVAGGGVVRNVGVADAEVEGHDYVGALVGHNEGRVSASWTSGTVNNTGDILGGLVGSNQGTIAASYSSATVGATGSDSVHTGGLVGWNSDAGASILASYATGSVSGDDAVGGLVGTNEGGVITASYSTGAVSGNGDVGGLVGVNTGTVTDSYWDTETSGACSSVRRRRSSGTGSETGADAALPHGYGTGTDIYANWNLDLDNADSDDSHSTGRDDPWDFGADYNYPTLTDAPGNQKAPGPVSGLTAAPNDGGNLVVTWSAPTDVGDGTLGSALGGVYAARYTVDGTTWIVQGVSQAQVASFGTTFTIASPDGERLPDRGVGARRGNGARRGQAGQHRAARPAADETDLLQRAGRRELERARRHRRLEHLRLPPAAPRRGGAGVGRRGVDLSELDDAHALRNCYLPEHHRPGRRRDVRVPVGGDQRRRHGCVRGTAQRGRLRRGQLRLRR